MRVDLGFRVLGLGFGVLGTLNPKKGGNGPHGAAKKKPPWQEPAARPPTRRRGWHLRFRV